MASAYRLRSTRLREKLHAGLALALCLASTAGFAEQRKPDANNQALRKAQGMLREMNTTLTALQTEKASMEEQLKKLNARVQELEGLPEQLRQQKASAESLHSSYEQLQSRLGNEARRYESLTAKQRATVQELGKYRRDNALLVQAVSERTQWIKTCGQKNAEMLKANRELLQQYRDKGLWSVLSAEPFTQVGTVAEENAMQDFQFKLQDLQVTPWREPEAGKEAGAPEAARPAEEEEEE